MSTTKIPILELLALYTKKSTPFGEDVQRKGMDMKEFDNFRATVNLGELEYEARKEAIRIADSQDVTDHDWDIYVRERCASIVTLELLRRYHEWISQRG